MKRLFLAIALTVLTVPFAVRAQEFDLQWSVATPLTARLAREVAQRVGGPPPSAAISVIEIDLDGDRGLSELLVLAEDASVCSGNNCPVYLLALVGDTYRDLLAGRASPRVNGLDQIQLKSEQRNYWLSLDIADLDYVWNGNAYVDATTIRPTDLSTGDFVEACRANEMAVNDNQLSADAADQLCVCVADGFERRAQPQSILDVATLEYRSGLPDTHPGKWTAVSHRNELVRECLVTAGLRAPLDVADYVKQQVTHQIDTVPFFDMCIAQDSLVDSNPRIGSPDRALGFCHCVSDQLGTGTDADTGTVLTQGNIDVVTQLFAGDIRDDEVAEEHQAAVEVMDRVAGRCISMLPERSFQP
jgi:hypothetical protein